MKKDLGEKLFYSISEVSEITDVKPHVLRYWETEFKLISLEKNKKGDRIYRQKDIENISRIKHLLYEEGYTIAGAKKKFSEDKNFKIPEDSEKLSKENKKLLIEIRNDLQEIYNKL